MTDEERKRRVRELRDEAERVLAFKREATTRRLWIALPLAEMVRAFTSEMMADE